MALKLSNVIGAPFPLFVTKQLVVRSFKNTTGYDNLTNRSGTDVLYLANKMAWVRLQSSVEIENTADPDSFLKRLQQDQESDQLDEWFNPDWEVQPASKWVLQSGTSEATIGSNNNIEEYNLREGIGEYETYFDGSYGLGGIKEQGYRPMPGLDSVTIETKGKLGSLRFATIKFKVWNRNQLDVSDMLYFRLGFTMLLEWGHVNYFVNETETAFKTNTSGVKSFFDPNTTKEKLQSDINKQVFETKGNYDGMLGVVTNYNYTLTQDGGWDCSIKLVGLGTILDTQRINNTYTMPDGLAKYYQKLAEQAISNAKKALQEQYEKDVQQAQADAKNQTQANIDAFNAANPIRSTADLGKAAGSSNPNLVIANATRFGYKRIGFNKIQTAGLDISTNVSNDPDYDKYIVREALDCSVVSAFVDGY